MPTAYFTSKRILEIRDKFKPEKRHIYIAIISIIALFFTIATVYYIMKSEYFVQRFDLSAPIVLPEVSLNNYQSVYSDVSLPLEKFPANYDSLIATINPQIAQKNRVELLRYGSTIFENTSLTPTSSTTSLQTMYMELINRNVPVQISTQTILLFFKQKADAETDRIINEELSPSLSEYLNKNIQYHETLLLLSTDQTEKSLIENSLSILKASKMQLDQDNYPGAFETVQDLVNLNNNSMATSTANTQTSEIYNKLKAANNILGIKVLATTTPFELSQEVLTFSTSSEAYKKLISAGDAEKHFFNEIYSAGTSTINLNTIISYNYYETRNNDFIAVNVTSTSEIYLEDTTVLLGFLTDIYKYKYETLIMLDINNNFNDLAKQAIEFSQLDPNTVVDTNFSSDILSSLSSISFPYYFSSGTSTNNNVLDLSIRLKTISSGSDQKLLASPIITYKDVEGDTAITPDWLMTSINNNNFGEDYDYLPVAQYGGVRVPILMYHQLMQAPEGLGQFARGLYISPDTFEKQIAYLTMKNYKSVSSEEMYNLLNTNQNPSQKTVMLTFDDGNYNHYSVAYPILKKYGQTGIFYIVTSKLAISPEQLKEMSDNGMVIDSHSASHANLQTNNDYGALTGEIAGSKYVLENITGKKVNSIAFPGCIGDGEAISVIRSSGYLIGVSCGYGIDHSLSQGYVLQRRHVFDDMDSFKILLSGGY